MPGHAATLAAIRICRTEVEILKRGGCTDERFEALCRSLLDIEELSDDEGKLVWQLANNVSDDGVGLYQHRSALSRLWEMLNQAERRTAALAE